MVPKPAPQLHARTTFVDHPQSGLEGFLGQKLHCCLELAILGTDIKPSDLESLQKLGGGHGPFYYSLASTSLDFLASSAFQRENGTEGTQLVALSRNTPLDALDCSAALTADGVLHLAVSQERYRTLGLEGKASTSGQKDRYNIEVHVRGKQFDSTKPHYHRVQESLGRRLGPRDLWLARCSDVPPDPSPTSAAPLCRSLPITLPKHLEDAAQFVEVPRSSAALPRGTSYPDPAALAACLYPPASPGPTDAEGAKRARLSDSQQHASARPERDESLARRQEVLGALVEYAGALLAGLASPGCPRAVPAEPPAESTSAVFAQPAFGYSWPCPEVVAEGRGGEVTPGGLLKWGPGLLPGPLALSVVRRAAQLIGQSGVAFVLCKGFRDSATSFAGGSEHGPGVSGLGENDCLVVLLPDGKCVLFALSGDQGGFKAFNASK